MDFDKVMDGLSKELAYSLKTMSKAKTLDEKEIHSRIVKNLCESLEIFWNMANEMMSFDSDENSSRDDIPF